MCKKQMVATLIPVVNQLICKAQPQQQDGLWCSWQFWWCISMYPIMLTPPTREGWLSGWNLNCRLSGHESYTVILLGGQFRHYGSWRIFRVMHTISVWSLNRNETMNGHQCKLLCLLKAPIFPKFASFWLKGWTFLSCGELEQNG